MPDPLEGLGDRLHHIRQDTPPIAAGGGTNCRAGADGECNWKGCPQTRDGEPMKSGRTCPLPWLRDLDDDGLGTSPSAPGGGTTPSYSEVARRFWGALTAGSDSATWPCWDDMDDDAHADIEFAVRTFDAFTPPASAPGGEGGDLNLAEWLERFLNPENHDIRVARAQYGEATNPDVLRAQARSQIASDMAEAIEAAVRRAAEQGRREGAETLRRWFAEQVGSSWIATLHDCDKAMSALYPDSKPLAQTVIDANTPRLAALADHEGRGA